MRAAIVENGIVINILSLDSLDDVPGAISSDTANIGHTYAGGLFSRPPPAPETPEQIQARLTVAVQAHLDATARADGWDSIYTASLRASNPAGPWYARGGAYLAWMDACWVVCHQVQAAVEAGSRPVPTPEELISELPPAP